MMFTILIFVLVFLTNLSECLLDNDLGLGLGPFCQSSPLNFPSSVQLTVTNFVNWDRELIKNNLWTATPDKPDDVVTLANWAHDNDYKLRAKGFMHGWAPLSVTKGTNECGNTILVDTVSHLNKMEMIPNMNQVKVQAGASMDNLLTFLEKENFGFYNIPAPGDITIGGALAIGAHGTSIPAANEATFSDGYSFGSLSSLVVSFTAVIWDEFENAYRLKTFQSSDTEASAFLVSLGRTFLTEVTMTVVKNYNMRCISRTDISMDQLCADSNTGPIASSFLDQTGRIEIILFPFTDSPWLKLWSVIPKKPLLSRPVFGPYNYIFSDNIPTPVGQLVGQITQGAWHLTPILGQALYTATATGLVATLSNDIWGKSKNVLLYVKPTTLMQHGFGYCVLTWRNNTQKVLHSFYSRFKALQSEYAENGKYPINGPVEIRFNSIEATNGINTPAISALRGLQSFEIGIWLNVLTIPNSPFLGEFMTKLESFIYDTFNNKPNSTVRVEWTKGYAYTNDGAWKNETILNNLIPNSFPGVWGPTVNTLDKYDPHRVFTNDFLDLLLVA